MHSTNSRLEFAALLTFLLIAGLVLANGFTERIFAAGESGVDTYTTVEPIADVFDEIMRNYVREPDTDTVVEGALIGMMNSLDRHSSYITAEEYSALREDTRGEFDGIGVSIKLDENKNIIVFQPIAGSPAAKAGVHAGDFIIKIDGVSTEGMSLADAADRIRGPRGTTVKLTVYRVYEDKTAEAEELEFEITRGRVPLESITEARVLDGGIGYLRVSDFKETTADEIRRKVSELSDSGMKSLILDLRWNPGGLLSASGSVCELFLPKDSLVTYTKGRDNGGRPTDDLRLVTKRDPVLPATMPIVVLINETTASSAEIVTGALQFWKRAVVVGEKSYGKGSVQTIVPLRRPEGAALRLTTALYYTPAEVTIDNAGIRPDVELTMDKKQQIALLRQMYQSYETNPDAKNEQEHGLTPTVPAPEGEEIVEDVQLKKALELLRETASLEDLIGTYHKDIHETQVAAAEDSIAASGNGKAQVEEPLPVEASPVTPQE